MIVNMENIVTSNLIADEDFPSLLLTWYDLVKRDLPWRKTNDPYAIWISEVMLQQTQVKTVIPYYEKFLQRFPCLRELAGAKLEDVLTVWRGLGYYSRARRLWEGARDILARWDGVLPQDYKSLRQIPGIGGYTAGAIASIAFGQKVPALDGNVKRVLSRVLAWPEPVEASRTLRYFEEQLMKWIPVHCPGEFNQALMELGAIICTPKTPDCRNCPVLPVCKSYRKGESANYPVKKPRTKPPTVTRLTFVLRMNDRVYLQKRPSHGMLADLWEFPGVELSQADDFTNHFLNDLDSLTKENLATKQLDDQAKEQLARLYEQAVTERSYDNSLKEQNIQDLALYGPAWHTFSHRCWKILWMIIDLSGCRQEMIIRESREQQQFWFPTEDLKELPIPVAFKAIVQALTGGGPEGRRCGDG